MATGSQRIRSIVFVTAVVLATVSPADANVVSRSDGDDSKSRLDITSVKVLHRPSGDHEFLITTAAPFTSADIRPPDGNFAISFDVNDPSPTDSNWRAEYWLYAFSTAKGFRGVVYSVAADRVIANAAVSKPSSRTIRVLLPVGRIGGPDSYRFAAWAYSELAPCTSKSPCGDVVPNRLPLLLHDYTPPVVGILDAPRQSAVESDTLAFPVTFRVDDDRYGSGSDVWKLQTRVHGTDAWKTSRVGGRDGRFTFDVTGTQGAVMETRVIAKDQAGNASESKIVATVVPFDDTAGLTLAYGPEWVASAGVAGRFLGTTHAATDATDAALSFTFTGTRFCLIGDGSGGTLTMTIDGIPQAQASLCKTTSAGLHTVDLTYTGPSWILDGIYVWP